MGGGGSGQCCHGNLVSSSPRQPAGDPALHRPAEGQHPHLEEGEMPQKVRTRFWLLPIIIFDYRSTGSVRHAGFQLEGERRVFLVDSEQVVLRERVNVCIVNKTLINDAPCVWINYLSGWHHRSHDQTHLLPHTHFTNTQCTIFTLYKSTRVKVLFSVGWWASCFLCSCWTASENLQI